MDRSSLAKERPLPASFRDFAHGYVVTSHKSQGRTHDQVVIAAAQMDAKAAYVACSRGRHQVSIFTPDKAHLFERAEQSGDRLAASDVLDPTLIASCCLAPAGAAGLAACRGASVCLAEDFTAASPRNRA